MKVKTKSKATVFIDGANIFYAQKHLEWTIDWKKVKKFLEEEFELGRIIYYTGIREKDEKMESFLKYLRHLGIETITKSLKIITDEKGKIIHKSNMDVEIAVDVLLNVKEFDVLLLFSGDSDFVYLTRVLKRNFQKKVFVYSSRKTISWELKLSADKYYFIEEFKNKLKRSIK